MSHIVRSGMFGHISGPVTTTQYRAERQNTDGGSATPPTPPSVVAAPTPHARDTAIHSGVDGCVQTVSCSGCPSMNARHTSTTAPCVNTWESDSILGAKTVGERTHMDTYSTDPYTARQHRNQRTPQRSEPTLPTNTHHLPNHNRQRDPGDHHREQQPTPKTPRPSNTNRNPPTPHTTTPPQRCPSDLNSQRTRMTVGLE